MPWANRHIGLNTCVPMATRHIQVWRTFEQHMNPNTKAKPDFVALD